MKTMKEPSAEIMKAMDGDLSEIMVKESVVAGFEHTDDDDPPSAVIVLVLTREDAVHAILMRSFSEVEAFAQGLVHAAAMVFGPNGHKDSKAKERN